jgi:hypothetical protein
MQGKPMKSASNLNDDDKLKKLRAALARQSAQLNLNTPIEIQLSNWINAGPKWNIAVTLHTPLRLRYLQNGYDELWLERQISVFFNMLSKKIFAGIPKKQRPMLRRLITLEKDTYVGWHAHGVITTPDHLDDDTLIDAINEVWGSMMNPYASREFKDRLVWCEAIRGNYQQYCVKAALTSQAHGYSGQFGTISLHNTHL